MLSCAYYVEFEELETCFAGYQYNIECSYQACLCVRVLNMKWIEMLATNHEDLFIQVMNNQHTFLHRNMLLLRACTEPLCKGDKIRLEVCE